MASASSEWKTKINFWRILVNNGTFIFLFIFICNFTWENEDGEWKYKRNLSQYLVNEVKKEFLKQLYLVIGSNEIV
jgi:hypothetical protein